MGSVLNALNPVSQAEAIGGAAEAVGGAAVNAVKAGVSAPINVLNGSNVIKEAGGSLGSVAAIGGVASNQIGFDKYIPVINSFGSNSVNYENDPTSGNGGHVLGSYEQVNALGAASYLAAGGIADAAADGSVTAGEAAKAGALGYGLVKSANPLQTILNDVGLGFLDPISPSSKKSAAGVGTAAGVSNANSYSNAIKATPENLLIIGGLGILLLVLFKTGKIHG